MKEGIHPKYVISKVVCACGNEFQTRSTRELIKLDICSACHPLFTGKQKMLDREGRVDKFKKKFAATEGKTVVAKKPAPKAAAKPAVAGKGKVLSTAPRKTALKSAALVAKAKRSTKAPKAAEAKPAETKKS
ncbi:MAG: 50S ribosomal protein L31 [Elusimicrobia bacterium]|nr:50S ribosomal protein L31 [Elusimicrobiota bacterium]